jgi:prepilin-type N-terminal cleavage/methylation domain-containing protein
MSLIKSRQTGFTLIEMMVTIAIAALLGLMVVPNLVSMVDSGKTSVLVNKFPQDVAWARNQAVTTQQPVTITLGANNTCTWSTSVGGTVIAEHSMSPTQIANSYPNVSCSITGGNTQTLTFDSQGFINTAPTIVVKASQGQTWTLQVLASGSVILNANTAS